MTTSLLASLIISQLILCWIAWTILHPSKRTASQFPNDIGDIARMLAETSIAHRDAYELARELADAKQELLIERDAMLEENDRLRRESQQEHEIVRRFLVEFDALIGWFPNHQPKPSFLSALGELRAIVEPQTGGGS